MAIELFCEVHGCELDAYVLNKKVTVTPCSKCESDARDSAYSEGAASRDDEIASLDADVANMTEQCRLLEDERDQLMSDLKDIETERAENTRTEPD